VFPKSSFPSPGTSSLFGEGGTFSEGGGKVTRIITFVFLLLVRWMTTMFDYVLQLVVFLTGLFYLLNTKTSIMYCMDVFLKVLDPSRIAFLCLERVLKSILLSPIKMGVFHGVFTLFIFSLYEMPVVAVPTAAAFLMALVPVFAPVAPTLLVAGYLW
jgi:hypothetical protein